MRPNRSYTDRTTWTGPAGIDVGEPVAGYYRHRVGRGTVGGVVRLWNGPPRDPYTGEELDRGWRWQADFDGEEISFDQVWPVCAGKPVTEAEYRASCNRRIWAREHAPNSAYAERGRKYDPLSTTTPLPF
jgi:hypothetical protein